MATSEYEKWRYAEWPYDLATCRNCAVMHTDGFCRQKNHAEMRADAKRLKLDEAEAKTNPIAFREAVLAFRKKWAKFYPKGKGCQ